MAVTLVASVYSWKFLVVSSAFALFYQLTTNTERKNMDDIALSCAKELRDLCRIHGLNHSLLLMSNSRSTPKELRKASRMLLLGHTEQDLLEKCGEEGMDELIELIVNYVHAGHEISKGLDMLISDLESKIDYKNKNTQSSLNMDTLSIFGIYFFVPVFGGIGASIMSGSMDILGAVHSPVVQFEALMVLYASIMAFIMSLFRSEKFAQSAFDSLKAAIIAGGIIKASAALVAYAI